MCDGGFCGKDLMSKSPNRPKLKRKYWVAANPNQARRLGGGGGGKNDPTPASQGRPPQMALTPQIIPPDPEPPKIKNPSLVVASTIYGDPKIMPPMKGPIGDPNAPPAPPSSGPGSGGGMGNSSGTGLGSGQGGGLGPGRGGNDRWRRHESRRRAQRRTDVGQFTPNNPL
jgi:Predicted membrane protein